MKLANENEIHVRQDPDFGTWSCFAKSLGEGFILDGMQDKEEAILYCSRVLLALNTHGVQKYHDHIDDMPEDSRLLPNYPVIED